MKLHVGYNFNSRRPFVGLVKVTAIHWTAGKLNFSSKIQRGYIQW